MLAREPRPARVGPVLDRGVPVVGELPQVCRGRLRAVIRGHDERGHDRSQGGGREACVLLPAILLRRGPGPGDEPRSRGDHVLERVLREQMLECLRVAASHPVHLHATASPEGAGQEDRIGRLVELDARPVGDAVHPLVLHPRSIGLLGGDQVGERATGGPPSAERNKRASGLDEIA